MSVTPAGYVFFAVVAGTFIASRYLTRGINKRARENGGEPNWLSSAYIGLVLFVIISLVASAVLVTGPLLIAGALAAIKLMRQGDMPDVSSEEIFGLVSAGGGFGLIVCILVYVLAGAVMLARGKAMAGWVRLAQKIGLFFIVPLMLVWFLSGFVMVMYWHVTGIKPIEGTGWVVLVGAVIAVMTLAIVGYGRALLNGIFVEDE